MSSQDVLAPAATAPPRFYGLLKASAAFLAVAVLFQGITAGQLLDGAGNGRELHQTGSGVVAVALLVTIVAAILVRRGGGSARYLISTLVMTAFVIAQAALGDSGATAVHVPLGVALMASGTSLVIQVWSQRPAK